MSAVVIVATALGSAVAAAASSVLQHRSARQAPDQEGGSHLRLVLHLARQPWWLLGAGCAVLGLALHVAALQGGQLTVVQPLLVSGLLFALPISVLLERRRPRLTDWLWALTVVVGLSTFLLAARPDGGSASASSLRLPFATAAGVVVMAGLVLAARPVGSWRALLLASAGGVGFGVASALMKQCTADAGRGISGLLLSWAIYGVVAVGGLAIVLTQAAYRAGPLAASLPAMTIGDPAAAVVIGVLAFQEQVAHTPPAVLFQVVGFALMTAGAWQLARR